MIKMFIFNEVEKMLCYEFVLSKIYIKIQLLLLRCEWVR